jgi:CheY-like chemotaxis protein
MGVDWVPFLKPVEEIPTPALVLRRGCCEVDESQTRFSVVVPKSKVLLVEDSKFLRIATERALSRAGYEVRTASDGEEALQLAQDQLPDIILLDMMLPKVSGPAVLKALKQNPATMKIPVVVLTSLSQKNEEKLLSEGAAAYFEKSTLELDKNSNRLEAIIQTVLGQPGPPSKGRS